MNHLLVGYFAMHRQLTLVTLTLLLFVEGQSDPNSFNTAIGNIGWIGVTFGGQFFFGNGVALTGGSAKYILIDFSVN